jgi:hypothetical protein
VRFRAKPSSVQVLWRLASSVRLFRSADGRFCAQVPVGDRLEIYRLKSAAFCDWLIDRYLNYRSEPPSSWAICRVIGMLEARARFGTGIPEVFVRVGQAGDSGDSPYFLDLGDPSGRAIAIRDQGWRVVDRPDVHFRRPEGLLPLPLPAHDGSIDLLRSHVNSRASWRDVCNPSGIPTSNSSPRTSRPRRRSGPLTRSFESSRF